MSNYHNNFTNPEQDSSEMEDFDDEEESYSGDSSDEDPSYTIQLIKAQSKLSKLSINKNSNSSHRDDPIVHTIFEEDPIIHTIFEDNLILPTIFDDDPLVPTVFEDGPMIDCSQFITNIGDPPITLNEGMSSQKLSKEDLKNFEHVQKMIDGGQVEKLKVEQCKVYLRKHDLRLTGKKEILIQRIKEHIEIQNGAGEKKYPPSSFVLNCKGDACLGDVVMFEQTVYEGYSIVSRSACGPPCGKRTIAGRIVNESYGAAKQQHTFTVEVLWSKGQKPLPPLYPLLIKGRNLYKLDTRRQKWVDEAERQRVLNEKHSRGTIARSNREARVQEKMGKMSLKDKRVNSKNKENPCHQKVSKRATEKISLVHPEKLASNVQQQGLPQSKVPSSRFHREPRSQFSWDDTDQNSFPAHGYQRHVESKVPSSRFHQEPRSQFSWDDTHQNSLPTHGYQRHVEYKGSSHVPVSKPPSYQQRRPIIHYNQEPYAYGKENLMTSSRGGYDPISDIPHSHQRMTAGLKHSTGHWQRPAQHQQLCRHFPQGRCHFGNKCKFLHEPRQNYC